MAIATARTTAARDERFFVRLEPVVEVIRAAIWSGRIANERPVSVMLIAQQESAKTEVLKYFFGTDTLRYVSDLTSSGLRPYKEDIERGKMRHIVILDLVRVLSHSKGVGERTLQSLAALMEEGETATSDAGGMNQWAKFPRIGALMGITPDFFKSKRGHWRKTGFLTRFIPVSYSYSKSTVDAIHERIKDGRTFPIPRAEGLPEFPNVVNISRDFSETLSAQAKMLGQAMSTHGFRYHRVLRVLAKARARLNGRGAVSAVDVSAIIDWSKFFTLTEVEL
jgi:hypothetical protein